MVPVSLFNFQKKAAFVCKRYGTITFKGRKAMKKNEHYEQWKQGLIQKVQEGVQNHPKLSSRGAVTVQAVNRINGIKREGLIMPELNPSGISPVLYLDELYVRHFEGVPDMLLVRSVLYQFSTYMEIDVNYTDLFDYEKMKGYLRIRVSGVEDNDGWINEQICEVKGDFVYSCYLDINKGNDDRRIVNINRLYASEWNVSDEQIMEDARKYSKDTVVELYSANGLEASRRGEGEPTNLLEHPECVPDDCMIFMLLELNSPFGASVIARDEILEMVGEVLRDDYYVMPSSISEVILIPARYGNEIKDFGDDSGNK